MSDFYEDIDPAATVTDTKTYLDSDELVLNMGPQHPSTHGVLRVILKLDGEKVLGTECVIGYLHRGVEKIAENRTYVQFNPYVDRMMPDTNRVRRHGERLQHCQKHRHCNSHYLHRQAGYGQMVLLGGSL